MARVDLPGVLMKSEDPGGEGRSVRGTDEVRSPGGEDGAGHLVQQQQKLQLCKKNWVQRITESKTVDRRRTSDLREEVGMQFR